MSRSGSAPPTVFATADAALGAVRRDPFPDPAASSIEAAFFCPGSLNSWRPRRDQGQASPRGTNLDEKHSAGQSGAHSDAQRTAADGQHHDPVRRIAGAGRAGTDADLEPLIFRETWRAIRLVWLPDGDLSAGDLRAVERIGTIGIALHHHRGREHDHQRHGCEDKADELQAVAVCHGRPLTSISYT